MDEDKRKGRSRFNKRKLNRRERRSAESENSQQNKRGTHGSISSTENIPREFPGHYYDPEKKKYFKISSEYPKSLVKNKNSEATSVGPKNDKLQNVWTSAAHYVRSREMPSTLSPEIFKRKGLEQWATHLVERENIVLPATTDSYPIIEMSPNCEKMLVVRRSARPIGHTDWACLYKVCCDKKFISLKGHTTFKAQSEVTQVQFNPNSNMENYLLCSVLGSSNSHGFVCTFSEVGTDIDISYKYQLRYGSAWHCSWCPNPQYSQIIGVAGTRIAILVDLAASWELLTISCPSDVFCVEFSHKTPIFYFGCRNGSIICADIRTKSVANSLQNSSSSVSCIKMLRDENYFMASNVNGMIKIWDARLLKPIKEYFGNVNETKLIPFVMDSSETFIASAGQDSKTRIWSIDTGKLLKTIDYPKNHREVTSRIPPVCLGEQWGNKGGIMGLALGFENKLQIYY